MKKQVLTGNPLLGIKAEINRLYIKFCQELT